MAGRAGNDYDATSIARGIYILALFVPPTFLHLTYAILDLPKTVKDRNLLRISYAISILLIPTLATTWFITGVIRYAPFFGVIPGPFYTVYVLFFGFTCALGFIKLLQAYRSASGVKKNQLRYIFVSWFLAYIAGLLHFMPSYFRTEPFPHDFLVIAFVVISSYAIIKYRLLDVRLALTRTAIFALAYVPVLGLPFLVGYLGQNYIRLRLGEAWWLIPMTFCALTATIGPFFYLALQRKAEGRLLQEQRRYQTVLRQAAQGMTLIKEMDRLLNLVVHILTRTVRVTHAAVYLLDKEAKVYVLRARRGGQGLEVGHTLPADSPVIAELFRQRGAIVQEELKLQLEGGGGPAPLVAAEQGMVAIQAAVAVPSFVEEQLLGFLLLGDKRSGKMYSQDDLQVFEVLASQAALAVENAQFYDELQRTQADLFQTAKMATLGQMAGGMSHQINNRFYVLTILAGTMKAALKGIAPDGATAAAQELIGRAVTTFEKIEDNAIRGGDIVKTLLRFSRPSRGDQKAISLQEMIETALDVVQYKIRMDELDFSKELPNTLPLVQGNLNQLADSLFNLFSNAYDAINSKKERLNPTGYRGAIQIKGAAIGGKVELTIHDNGIGMTPQEQTQLFIPFFTTKATSEKGTGLGLFIIKRIIEHHGGQIQVRSTFGEGTTFVITLPAVQSQQAVA